MFKSTRPHVYEMAWEGMYVCGSESAQITLITPPTWYQLRKWNVRVHTCVHVHVSSGSLGKNPRMYL